MGFLLGDIVHSPVCEPVQLLLPTDYPSSSAPFLEVSADHLHSSRLAEAIRQLERSFVPGSAVLFEWAQQLCDLHTTWQEQQEQAAALAALDLGGAASDDARSSQEDEALPDELADKPEATQRVRAWGLASALLAARARDLQGPVGAGRACRLPPRAACCVGGLVAGGRRARGGPGRSDS